MMSVLVKIFVSGRYRRFIDFTLWLIIAVALLAAAFLFARHQLRDSLKRDVAADLAQLDKLHQDVTSAFDVLDSEATAQPCSEEFLRQLRRVAFRPDGLNEFIYAPGGMVTCSTSISGTQRPLPLGEPDIPQVSPGSISYWIDTRLEHVGLLGMSGIVVHRDPFAIVIPLQTFRAGIDGAGEKELVAVGPNGHVWHVSGTRDLYQEAAAAPDDGLMTARETLCGKDHSYCITTKSNLASIMGEWQGEILIAIFLIAFYAVWPASTLQRWLNSYWSLPARFRRNLNIDSVICAYQPILDLRTGQISGCEVLARWRDVDGSVVAPDKFIDIVAHSGQTLAFTKMVADRAHLELSQALPAATRLQVNFNIFPRDLDSEELKSVFSAFDGDRERFQIALEIVESDALSVEVAEREIEALGRLGFRTYIDDFGSGYSSIHRVASLAIHGVKLDRSFAMAPSESMMARMLVHALDMVGSCDREIVVEGVETQERLDLLLESGRVAYAQGYLISRPLPIERLAEFLAKHDPAAFLAREAREAA